MARSPRAEHRLVVDGELLLFGAVGDGFGESFTAREVAGALSTLNGPLTVRVNSGGGSVFDGVAIHEALKAYKGDVTVRVDGIAASAASVIAMAGKTIIVPEAAMVMIHKAWALTIGNAEDHTKNAGVLDKIDGQLAGIYAKRTGLKRAKVADMMAAETWMTGEEALALGFADAVSYEEPAPFATFDYSRYQNAPDGLATAARPVDQSRTITTIRGLEHALRDAGFNKHEAKRLCAGGWKAFRRASEALPGASEIIATLQGFTRELRLAP